MKKEMRSSMLELLRKQREFFIRDAGGRRIITNYIVYNSFEEELFEVQIKISKENKKRLKENPDYIEYREKHRSHKEGEPHTKECIVG